MDERERERARWQASLRKTHRVGLLVDGEGVVVLVALEAAAHRLCGLERPRAKVGQQGLRADGVVGVA